jgi:hypothetical protein
MKPLVSPEVHYKSLYDLIKGLRGHKGGENEYIQSSLRECKAEIKTVSELSIVTSASQEKNNNEAPSKSGGAL